MDLSALPGASPAAMASHVSTVPSPGAAPAVDASDPAFERLLDARLDALRAESRDPSAQGILVETLFGDVLMAHDVEMPINPASVMKLAPTLMALERFGPDYRFRTAFLAGGPIRQGVLDGPLGVRCDGDPTFGREQVAEAAAAVRAAGVRQVHGDLVVVGPFSLHNTEETPTAAGELRDALVRAGVSIDGAATLADTITGTELTAVVSEPLIDIIQRQNDHSVNRIADNLGTTVGGPAAVERYLVENVGVAPSEITVSHTSGLGHNAISARGAMLLLRALYDATALAHLPLDRVMPLNGVDDGTMHARMVSNGLEGAVVAKTGTHYTQDGGISSLCGLAYTREQGPVFFVILNSQGPVHEFRRWEDALVADLITASGGAQPLARAAEVTASKVVEHTLAGRDPFTPARMRGRSSRAD
jgi:D-alanyl-D-alanine carboxypeptidase/D-alanyl-D-alanine-endopeptidase (penicillin-binding protein 4)